MSIKLIINKIYMSLRAKRKELVICFSITLFVIGLVANLEGAFSFYERVKGRSKEFEENSDFSTKKMDNESEMERRIYDEKYEKRCEGAQFDIVEDLMEVGGERFSFPIEDDDHVASVSGTKLYQASYKTGWGCTFPFTTTITVIPVSGPSFGLFLEIENIYKIVVGDGDRVSVKLQKNNLGYRGEWPEVFKEKLSKPIEDKRPVTLIVETLKNNGWIQIHIEVYHSGISEPEVFGAEFLPLTASLTRDQKQGFRVGINDFRHKGNGSLVRLGTLSVGENVE